MQSTSFKLKRYWMVATLLAMVALWMAYPHDHSLLPALLGIGFVSFLLYAVIWLLRRLLKPRPRKNVP